MIALLLLQSALGTLPTQALPPTGCAAFLWTRGAVPQLVAMVGSEPGTLRLQIDGQALVLPRTTAEGAAGRGFATTSRYAAGAVTAMVELSALERPDLSDGALVPEAMLTVEQAGKDAIVAPVGGLIGCASAAPETAVPNRR